MSLIHKSALSSPYDRITRAAMAQSHRGFVERADAGGHGGRFQRLQPTLRSTTETPGDPMQQAETQSNKPVIEIPVIRSQQGENHTDHNAREPDQQRANSSNIPTTEVIVHYAAPAGQRYLPIYIGEYVTMVRIGQHNMEQVFEPINDYLHSTEEGLRYHRSMDERDVYEGPLDMAKFGRPVSGAVSANQQWVINPLAYDPTRPSTIQHAETHSDAIVQHSLDTPTGNPRSFGFDAGTSDIDLGLLSELGRAVSRGAERLVAEDPHSRWKAPTASSGEPGHREHVAQPVLATAPQTPKTVMVPSMSDAVRTPLGDAAEAGLEICGTTASAVVGACGGALAGGMSGGDLAVANLGPSPSL
jgi:hypothetical protein